MRTCLVGKTIGVAVGDGVAVAIEVGFGVLVNVAVGAGLRVAVTVGDFVEVGNVAVTRGEACVGVELHADMSTISMA
jgi:hypothetical protein